MRQVVNSIDVEHHNERRKLDAPVNRSSTPVTWHRRTQRTRGQYEGHKIHAFVALRLSMRTSITMDSPFLFEFPIWMDI